MRVLVEDPSPSVTLEDLRAALTDDVERLAALGGDLEFVQAEQVGPNESRRAALRLLAWLPDRLDALLQDPVVGAAREAPRREHRGRLPRLPRTCRRQRGQRRGRAGRGAGRRAAGPRAIAHRPPRRVLARAGRLHVGVPRTASRRGLSRSSSRGRPDSGTPLDALGEPRVRAVLDAPRIRNRPSGAGRLRFQPGLPRPRCSDPLTRRGTVWSMRLLALAMLAASGTGQSQRAGRGTAVRDTVAHPGRRDRGRLLQSVASGCLPTRVVTYPFCARAGRPGPREVLTIGLTTVVLSRDRCVRLPAAVSYIVLFGLVLPLAGLALLRRRGRDELTADERTRLRLLFSVFVGAATVAATLVVVTVATWSTGWDGLTLRDPTAPASEPKLIRESALLFWFCRLMTVGIGVSVLTAAPRIAGCTSRNGGSAGVSSWRSSPRWSEDCSWSPHRDLPARGAAGPVALVDGPGRRRPGSGAGGAGTPSIYLRVERWVDRLLYGRRPAPYSVLAGHRFPVARE